ncbi:thymidylate synthase [endosymbiont GvMRE of Glomus versiforme]|uniref:thymidylate synthase n=1 Tax=endosymbiont GvMRE of Glomus versiforme TaxID=2039283 RepID=UPI000EE0B410|nr:thymidylate synthase [endosymbiont GvMRE of Glomus versiforme]RHZ37781.1 Thymidylate synthase [endosymbiont GvMRE of Glomus versiforme]
MNEEYLRICRLVLEKGQKKKDRTDIGTISYFGTKMEFDLKKGFPLLTTKKMPFRLIVHELLWFIKGDTNIKYLVDNNVNIWNEWPFEKYKEKIIENPRIKIVKKSSPHFLRINKLLETEKKLFKKLDRKPSINEIAKELKKSKKWILETDKLHLNIYVEKIKKDQKFAKKYGDLGPIYGKQWRNFGGVDQLKALIENLKNNPFSRRHILTAWNPNELEKMALPPCHLLCQFEVSPDYRLSCLLYQRSGDLFLGVPFNIASYSLLTMMLAQVCGYKVGKFIHIIGDAHLYLNHLKQTRIQLVRQPKTLPQVELNPQIFSLFDFTIQDIILKNYHSWPTIKGEVAV